jgi:hypothetical protein
MTEIVAATGSHCTFPGSVRPWRRLPACVMRMAVSYVDGEALEKDVLIGVSAEER